MSTVKKILLTICSSFLLCQGAMFGQQSDTIIGAFDRQEFLSDPYKEWYNDEYQNYELNKDILGQIQLENDTEVLIYLGTWCGDSRREVPRFIKILDYLKYDMSNLKMLGLNRKKTAPDYMVNIWNIEYVPTFIFLKEGKEIGRIIETPELSLEEDLQSILTSLK